MSKLIEIVESEFEAKVLNASRPVLVDFGAEWCHPCKRLDPIVEELAQEWGAQIDVYKVDVDASAQTAMKHGVMGVPTLMLFKQGQAVERVTGYALKRKLIKVFEPHLSTAE